MVQGAETENGLGNRPRAGFMLSTGRAGSGTFALLCQQSGKAVAFHEPRPLMVEAHYRAWCDPSQKAALFAPKAAAMRELLEAGRKAKPGAIYVETANKLSLFVDELDRHFDARFLWVIRSPFDFVNSGLNRRWYSGANGEWDTFRLRRRPDWPAGWSDAERIAWLWCEVNRLIEAQTAALRGRVRIAHFEDWTDDMAAAAELLAWFGIDDVPPDRIGDVLELRTNAGRTIPPRSPATGDNIHGAPSRAAAAPMAFPRDAVARVVRDFWPSPLAERYLAPAATL